MQKEAMLEWIEVAGWRGLVVHARYVRYTEPILDHFYWPVAHCECSKSQAEDLFPLGQVLHNRGTGIYGYRLPGGRDVTVYLKDGGRTQAVKIEQEAIPCPKVRKGIETRWQGTYWQKLLKTGWTVA